MTVDRQKRGVIFDLDGVLIDTGSFHKQSFYDLAQYQGFEMTEELFSRIFGMQNYQIIPILLNRPATDAEIQYMSDWKEQRYRDLIVDHLYPMKGVIELIRDLKNNSFLLAIGTSAPKANLDLILKNIDLADYFDAYVVGEQVKNSKPAPDTFLEAAKRLSLDPDRCVVVEDAVVGVQAAKAAGMAVVAVTNTTTSDNLANAKADLIVDSLSKIKAQDFIKLLE